MITVDVSFIITYENAERILKNLKVHLAIYFLLVMNMLERKSKENGEKHEEQIEDCAKQWLLKDKNIKYFTKTESINDVVL